MKLHKFFQAQGAFEFDAMTAAAQSVWLDDSGVIDDLEVDDRGNAALVAGDHAFVIGSERDSDGVC